MGVLDRDIVRAHNFAVNATLDEMGAQVNKWGVQSHSDGTGPEILPLYSSESFLDDTHTAEELAKKLTKRTDFRFSTEGYDRPGTWTDILLEEVFEALAESDEDKLFTELSQVAAVAMSWMRDIKSRDLA